MNPIEFEVPIRSHLRVILPLGCGYVTKPSLKLIIASFCCLLEVSEEWLTHLEGEQGAGLILSLFFWSLQLS